jgi:hypothetical protein
VRDPYKIIRQRPVPFAQPCFLTTRGAGKLAPLHIHRAYPDEEGNGTTDIRASHFHRIISWRVIASPVDSHEHEMTRLLCGAGI